VILKLEDQERRVTYLEGNRKGSLSKVLHGKFHNARSVGRPRTRLEDVVQRDALKVVGIRGWRKRHGDREKWRRFLREVSAQ
jgi:hypothetical protein